MAVALVDVAAAVVVVVVVVVAFVAAVADVDLGSSQQLFVGHFLRKSDSKHQRLLPM